MEKKNNEIEVQIPYQLEMTCHVPQLKRAKGNHKGYKTYFSVPTSHLKKIYAAKKVLEHI